MIYHFCPRADWETAASSGSYTADSLATQGFIHCSPRDHLHVSATMRARGRTDLVVLEIDEARLDAPSVWEEGDPPDPDGKLFPHVYGPIPIGAVVRVTDLPTEPDGTFAPLG
ncbi:MAG TPA: DUF952 domain-containing protein [Actinoplanes sp.]|nr:DUF952 domain-containing protein [Actinoplanes sp.]